MRGLKMQVTARATASSYICQLQRLQVPLHCFIRSALQLQGLSFYFNLQTAVHNLHRVRISKHGELQALVVMKGWLVDVGDRCSLKLDELQQRVCTLKRPSRLLLGVSWRHEWGSWFLIIRFWTVNTAG